MTQTGRPKVEWNETQWEQFQALCEIQCTAVEVCSVMGVCEETLNRLCEDRFDMRFSEYIKSEAAGGRTSLRRMQWDAARQGNPTMLVWLGKQYLGQSDKLETQNQNVNKNYDMSTLTDEQIDKILAEDATDQS